MIARDARVLARTVGRLAGVLALVATTATTAHAAAPTRVLFETSVGPLVVALDGDAAPRATAQLTALVARHAYDGVPFARIVRGFAATLAQLDDPSLAGAAPLPLETSPSLRHRRGSLSVTHPTGRPDAGDASFAILFDAAPALDGRYTVFGQVVEGAATLDALEAVLTDGDGVPIDRVELRRARVLDAGEAVALPAASPLARPWPLVALAAIMMLFGAAVFLLAGRVSARTLASLGLLSLLVAFVPAFALVLPYARASRVVAVVLFAGAFGLFRLMNRFEGPR